MDIVTSLIVESGKKLLWDVNDQISAVFMNWIFTSFSYIYIMNNFSTESKTWFIACNALILFTWTIRGCLSSFPWTVLFNKSTSYVEDAHFSTSIWSGQYTTYFKKCFNEDYLNMISNILIYYSMFTMQFHVFSGTSGSIIVKCMIMN